MQANQSSETFEQILHHVEALRVPSADDSRQVHWCGTNGRIGISRQRLGGREIFLIGDELYPTSPLVRRHLKFDRWARSDGEVFQANRIVFPAEEHYVPLVAFLVEELIRNSLTGSTARAFTQTEPLIEMALRRLAISDDVILGLLGELRFLEVLLAVEGNSQSKIAKAVDSWRGHEWNSRDFSFNDLAIEIKTTRGDESRHSINSTMQVDPRRTSDGTPREQLYLVSLGMEPVVGDESTSVGITLPDQVELLLRKCVVNGNAVEGRSDLQLLLLSKIEAFGGASSVGYNHDKMKEWVAYKTRWRHKFVRIYDMSDDAISILRRRDVQLKSHLIPESVQFDIVLPDSVSGDRNPQVDLFAFAARVAGRL